MSNNVKSFSVGYNPINKSDIFTSGDCITGQVMLELTKESKIDSLFVQLKGKAEVKWTEYYGKTVITYYNKEKYFSLKQCIMQEDDRAYSGNNIVNQGCHVYPFTFNIPAQDLPSSFKGSCGKIAYSLKANLSRSMRADSKAKAKFTLIHYGNKDQTLMAPQHNITEKKMNLFTSGTVGMDVNIERTGFHQGEGIKVVVSIHNKSSRNVTPKFCLYVKNSYFAKKKRKVQTKDILKEVGDAIPPSAGQTVTKMITVPPTICPSILNCSILKVEYRLRVYLDVKYASDPEIKFPIVILPALPEPDEKNLAAHATNGYEAFGSSDMQDGTSFFQNPTASGPWAPPPAYETYGMYPSLTNCNEQSY